MTDTADHDVTEAPQEDLESFRLRAQAWLTAEMPRITAGWDALRESSSRS